MPIFAQKKHIISPLELSSQLLTHSPHFSHFCSTSAKQKPVDFQQPFSKLGRGIMAGSCLYPPPPRSSATLPRQTRAIDGPERSGGNGGRDRGRGGHTGVAGPQEQPCAVHEGEGAGLQERVEVEGAEVGHGQCGQRGEERRLRPARHEAPPGGGGGRARHRDRSRPTLGHGEGPV